MRGIHTCLHVTATPPLVQNFRHRSGRVSALQEVRAVRDASGVVNVQGITKATKIGRGDRDRLATQQGELARWLRQRNENQESIVALPPRVRCLMKDMQDTDVRHGKALLQGILKSASVYNDGRIEMEFRTTVTPMLPA